MKKLSNLIGAKALNKAEQQLIFGGINENDPRIPKPTDAGNGGSATGGGGDNGNDCPWSQCRNRFNRCVPEGLGTCA